MPVRQETRRPPSHDARAVEAARGRVARTARTLARRVEDACRAAYEGHAMSFWISLTTFAWWLAVAFMAGVAYALALDDDRPAVEAHDDQDTRRAA